MRRRYLITVGLLLIFSGFVTLFVSQYGGLSADIIDPILQADELKRLNNQQLLTVTSIFLLGFALTAAGAIALIAALL